MTFLIRYFDPVKEMNYIKQLQEENNNLKQIIANCRNEIQASKIFLNSSKFTGVESDGSRKDWIATGDVQRILGEFERILSEANFN